jgi:hypothetical protein
MARVARMMVAVGRITDTVRMGVCLHAALL